ncbi:unnamed protein product [marine sediment metagenome]|uniref:Carboxypeptidase regulatory-like domain-containing protein n=1 Tax=marine sediment metagenome TaxID=412755 RepID=X0W205_9ZZZZ
MSGERTTVRFWLMLVLGLFVAACSNVENKGMEPRSTMKPDSTVELSEVHPSNTFDSGVEGYVWIGPTCPVVIVGTECPDRPFEAELTVTYIEGKLVVRSKSGADGFFRILLSPGSYVLVPERLNPNAPPFVQPIPFDVNPGSFTHLEITYASGMR